MRKAKAIAITARQESPLVLAMLSLGNAGAWLVDFMYGTPGRTKLTLIFACALALLGAALSIGDANAMTVCPV